MSNQYVKSGRIRNRKGKHPQANLISNLIKIRGAYLEKLGGGIWPASQNPYLVYDQNLRFSLPYL